MHSRLLILSAFFQILLSSVAIAEIVDPFPPEIVRDDSAQKKIAIQGEPYVIKAKITDESGIKSAKLYYRPKLVNLKFYKQVLMLPIYPGSDEFLGIIPGQEVQGLITEYYITAEDVNGNIAKQGNKEKNHWNFTSITQKTKTNSSLNSTNSSQVTAHTRFYKTAKFWYMLGGAIATGIVINEITSSDDDQTNSEGISLQITADLPES